ncbi:hypothetical protein [Tolypothrix sp. NIES-4075]|uniref:hypothetical protein n=1 Tax=Tolypothrix sp. NIES-4075 TaxID=2005459 RepID=UPI000B5CBC42|nr:hypothetical protein [Tolypothrix sp. NIES-4075]
MVSRLEASAVRRAALVASGVGVPPVVALAVGEPRLLRSRVKWRIRRVKVKKKDFLPFTFYLLPWSKATVKGDKKKDFLPFTFYLGAKRRSRVINRITY